MRDAGCGGDRAVDLHDRDAIGPVRRQPLCHGGHGAAPGNADRARLWLHGCEILARRLRDSFDALFHRTRHDDGIMQTKGLAQLRFEVGITQGARNDLDADDTQIPRLLQKPADLPPVQPGFIRNIGEGLVLLIGHAGDAHHQVIPALVNGKPVRLAAVVLGHASSPAMSLSARS